MSISRRIENCQHLRLVTIHRDPPTGNHRTQMAELFQDRTLARRRSPAAGGPVPVPVPAEEAGLEGKVLGLFFSAAWCPPCRLFVPLLRQVYGELRGRGAPFEVVFVSFDRSEAELEEHVASEHGDWLYVPFGDSLINELKEKYSVVAVPQLLILKPDGEVMTTQGRKQVQDRGVACFTSWSQQVGMNLPRKT